MDGASMQTTDGPPEAEAITTDQGQTQGKRQILLVTLLEALFNHDTGSTASTAQEFTTMAESLHATVHLSFPATPLLAPAPTSSSDPRPRPSMSHNAPAALASAAADLFSSTDSPQPSHGLQSVPTVEAYQAHGLFTLSDDLFQVPAGHNLASLSTTITPSNTSLCPTRTLPPSTVSERSISSFGRSALSRLRRLLQLPLTQKSQKPRSPEDCLQASPIGLGGFEPALLPRSAEITYGRSVERGLPSGETQDERAQHIMRQLFERDIRIEVPLANGDRPLIVARAWLDWFCPCNLVDQRMLEGLPSLKYDSIDREHYAITPAGRAYSTARFEGRWFCADIDAFDPCYDPTEFRVSDHDLRCDVIIGRPAIIKHKLFQGEPSMPLAVPLGVRTPHIRIDRMSRPFTAMSCN
ncbi:uncharacterized protein N0V89_001616 [Didymosphaeria variabile]|uniref:Uncharacterized protein n=1 Tax=Didymosphaeria variabile TaxID=1932322 RepID=A0A9W8XZ27_9PLEO|nr:uncharacterized protein N0V89_001616 [Didymosphaeria variabile]KAJ4361047.1 hypothetical protein N0V89_001616 [Didymosphaeria variabile]